MFTLAQDTCRYNLRTVYGDNRVLSCILMCILLRSTLLSYFSNIFCFRVCCYGFGSLVIDYDGRYRTPESSRASLFTNAFLKQILEIVLVKLNLIEFRLALVYSKCIVKYLVHLVISIS